MEPKAIILQHGEKMAIGLALLLVIGGYVGLFGGESVDPQDLAGLAKEIKDSRDAQSVPALPDMGFHADIGDQWENVPTPQPLPKWAVHRKYFVARKLLPPTERKKGDPPLLVTPTVTIAERGSDFIRLDYEVGIEREARISRVELHRTTQVDRNGDPVFSGIPYKDLSADETEFKDTEGIRPRQNIYYKVVVTGEITGDQDFVDGKSSKESEILLVAVPASLYLLPLRATPGKLFPKKVPAEAYLEVVKWDTENKKWIWEQYTVKAGQDIGKIEKIMAGNDKDMRTGFKLVDAGIERREIKIGGVNVPKNITWITVRDSSDPEAKPERFENLAQIRAAIKLRKDNPTKLIPEEGGGDGAEDEEEPSGEEEGESGDEGEEEEED